MTPQLASAAQRAGLDVQVLAACARSAGAGQDDIARAVHAACHAERHRFRQVPYQPPAWPAWPDISDLTAKQQWHAVRRWFRLLKITPVASVRMTR